MKLSLFSVSYAGFWGQHALELPAFIAKAAELGYDAVMLAGKRPHLSPLDVDEDRIAAIRAMLAEHGIACDVVAGYTDLSPPRRAEVPYLEMQIAYVESLARIAAELGASVVRVFTAYEVDGHSPHAIWNGVVAGAAGDVRPGRGARRDPGRAEPPRPRRPHRRAAGAAAPTSIGRTARLGFDAWSPALRGEELYEAARKMAPHTAITTNADYVRLPRFRYQPELVNYERAQPDMVRAVKFGEGFIDYAAFFRGLQDGGFDGIANYEMCSPIRGGGSTGEPRRLRRPLRPRGCGRTCCGRGKNPFTVVLTAA